MILQFVSDFFQLHQDKSFIETKEWLKIRDCLITHLDLMKISSISALSLLHTLKSGVLTEGLICFFQYFLFYQNM